MNPNTPAVKYNYEFFLFTQLAFAYDCVNKELEYDFLFGDLITMYEDFLKSGYDDGYKNLYECYEDYFRNLKDK
jgi:hypothetical protein